MIVLGIDPGIARTGWAILRIQHGEVKEAVYDCLTTKSSLSLEKRLIKLHDDLARIIKTYHPSEAAIEQLFFNKNTKTAMTVGQARGVTLLALAKTNLPVFNYTPLEIKLAITGYGRAEKSQVQRMVKTILKLSETPKPDDVSDALAVGLTHAFSRRQ